MKSNVVNSASLAEEGRMGCSHNADVAINSRDSLIRPGLEELAADDFLHGQDDTVLASNADSCAAVLDCLHGILDL